MHFHKIVLYFLITVILSGCSSNSTDPIQIESEEMIRISGALNKSFFTFETQYTCQSVIKTWDIGKTLFLSIKARNISNTENEQVSMNFYIPLDSDELPMQGKYYSTELSDNFSGVSYKNQWNNKSSSQYRFETGMARIFIEEINNGNLIGKFSLSARQSYGQRTLNGQVENVNLANEGKITVYGKIDVELDL
jgi:hypothetical protein